jgi:hypothetical protein
MPTVSVSLTFPADPSFLRLARLAAADAGSRAGFTFEDIDDLRIGIDELSHRLLGGVGIVTIVFDTADGTVEARGEGTEAGTDNPSEISQAIVAAVVDEHAFGDRDGHAWFRLLKRGTAATDERD